MSKEKDNALTDVLDELKAAKPAVAAFDPAKAWADQVIKHERQLIRCRFSPCGKFVAAGGFDRLVHVWELASEKKFSLAGHATWISALVFNPQGRQMFTADFHGVIHAWDYAAEGSKPLFTIPKADANITRALAVTLDGKHLLSAGDDAVVRQWDAASGKLVREFPGHKECVFSLALHPDGKTFVSGDLLGVVKQWDLATGKCARDLDASALHTRKADFIADVGGVRSLAFDAAGKQLACGGMRDAESNAFCPGTPVVLILDWATGKSTRELKLANKADGPVNALRFLSDGTLAGYAESQSGATELAFWNATKDEPFHHVKGSSGYDLDIHPDGLRMIVPQFVAAGSGGNGGREKLKDKYFPNTAALQVYNLFEKPAGKGPVKAPAKATKKV